MSTKKDLKEAYKQMKFKIGVYQIRNTTNGKIYISSSVNLDAMWNRCRVQLNFGNHTNPELQSDWTKFGEENFRYEILAEIEQKDNATTDYNKESKELELLYIEELQPFEEKGYNKKTRS